MSDAPTSPPNPAEETLLRTPLYAWHVEQGARMVPFAGWEMPVLYSSPIEEHHLTRRSAGLFDICHMGQVEISGPEALEFLNTLASANVSRIVEWGAQYALMCNENGGVVDDIFIYRLPEKWLVVINAANRDKDVAWITQHAARFDVEVNDISDVTAMFALQGPNAIPLLKTVVDRPLDGMPRFSAMRANLQGVPVLIGRTGYTGEDGVELYLDPTQAVQVWKAILAGGTTAEIEVGPIGLAARDSLRLEPGFSLYGHEITEEISPLEARLGWACHFDVPFIGSGALLAQKAAGLHRKLVAFKLTDRGVPRDGYPVAENGQEIGTVVSGMFLPTVELYGGHALVESSYAKIGTEFDILIRNKPKRAVVVKRPFYKPAY